MVTSTQAPSLSDAARILWDVAVVGAGPAGSMAAHALSRQSLKVLLVDRAKFPRWKVCGACLNPFTLSLLEKSGTAKMTALCGAVPIRQMHLAAGRSRATIPLSGWQVLSRRSLDAALVEAAQSVGTQFLPGTQAELGRALPDRRILILRYEGEQAEVSARLVVAADGLGGGLLRGEEGCAIQVAPRSRIGVGAVLDSCPPFYEPEVIHMAYGPGGYVGCVRLEDGKLNVAAALEVAVVKKARGPATVIARLLEQTGWPAIANLSDVAWQGTPPLTRQPTRPAATRVLAIGDAGGYVEPFTGEGIGWAMASGCMLAEFAGRAVHRWQASLADQWIALQKRNKTQSCQLCRAVTWVSQHPALARSLVGIVGRWPRLADLLLRRIAWS